MTAVEYNGWMSILDFITEQTQLLANTYGIKNETIHVIPSYPRDLTKFKKPAIIVQKIQTIPRNIGFGSVLGMYTDDEGNPYDVKGRLHHLMYQINIDARNNNQCSLMTSMVAEGMFLRASDADDPTTILFKDFLGDKENPEIQGEISLYGEMNIIPLSSNNNNDYMQMIRVDLGVIQHVINTEQEIIDLSRIKWNQRINV